MELMAVLALVSKGVALISALSEAATVAAPAIKTVAATVGALVTGAQHGKVTELQLAETELLFDSMIEDFNLEIVVPPQPASGTVNGG